MFEIVIKTMLVTLFLTVGLTNVSCADESKGNKSQSLQPGLYALFTTSKGTITCVLFEKEAPKTVANFVGLADGTKEWTDPKTGKKIKKNFYDGLIFHRVIPGFMVQGGGYTPGLELKEDDATIPNESGNGMSNVRGTIAMARTNDPHSANTQFFINVADNVRLDPGNNSWGYAVFGYVIEGMEVVDKIASVQTGPQGKLRSDVPVVPVVIKKMSRVTYD